MYGKFRFGINARALAATVVPAFFLFAILTLMYMSERNEETKTVFQQKGKRVADAVAAVSEFPLLFGDRNYLIRPLTAYINDPEIYTIEILDADKKIFLKKEDEKFNKGESEIVIFERAVNSTIDDINTFDVRDDISVNVIEGDNTGAEFLIVGYVKIGMSTHIKQEKQLSILISGVLLGGVTLIISIFIGSLFGKSIVNPVRHIMSTVAKIRKGDYEIRTNSKSKDEIAALGSDIDLLAKELGEAKKQQKHMLSDLTQAKNEADRANAKKTNFLALVSHDLRNPLNALLLSTEAMKETDINEYQRKLLRTTHLSADLLHRLIESILDISVMEAGQFHIEQKYFSLTDSINDALAKNKEFADRRGLKLDVSFDIDTGLSNVYVYTDPVRLHQILDNLISNAIKFTNEGGVYLDIALYDLSTGRAKLVIEVKDTGIGIPDSHLSSIFDMFEQVDPPSSKRHEGMGLGLAITKQLAEAMGGAIEVESELLKGSLFRVGFTVDYKSRDIVEEFSSRTKLGSIGVDKSKRILLVEDNFENQQSVATILNNVGLQVDLASNGHEGYQKFVANEYHIVFIDCFMPGMDGYELASKIRSYEKTHASGKRASLIALTAAVQHKDIDRCYQVGMDDVITKPYSIIDLYKWVAGSLSAENKVLQLMKNKDNSDT